MKTRRSGFGLMVAGSVMVSIAPWALAQADSDRALTNFDRLVSITKAAQARLGAEAERVSGGTQQVFGLANHANEVRSFLAASAGLSAAEGPSLVSRFGGFTESEPSVAWWGRNAVVGFNDSGSFSHTVLTPSPSPSPSGSWSMLGWSVSRTADNDTGSFLDQGILLPDPLPSGISFMFLEGDPVVRASGPSTFYFSSLAMDADASGESHTDVTVSKSIDGGKSFGGATIAVSKLAAAFVLDKDWMAVSGDRIYIAYRSFNFLVNCGAGVFETIELVSSADGGATWSTPTVLDSVCSTNASLQGVELAVGPDGELYAAWEYYAADFFTRHIRVARSVDNGATFGPIHVASSVTAVGDGFAVQGLFRTFLDFQGLAVDTSAGPFNGRVYVSWHDGRNASNTEPFSLTGAATYNFADVFVASSADGGITWTAPVRVNQDPITNEVDQLFPALAVDSQGQVGVLYYDRRDDPQNFLINVVLATSTDGGGTWQEKRVNRRAFPSVVAQDLLVDPFYMGDYLGLSADGSGNGGGFIAAWGDNSRGHPGVQTFKGSVQILMGDDGP
jgi:hypothetical protein